MKKIIRSIVLILFITLSPLFSHQVFADEPPNPGGGPGSGDLPVGGGSPIGSGLVILLSLGAAYGLRKTFHWKKNQ